MQFPHVPSVSALAARRTAFSAVRDLTSRVKWRELRMTNTITATNKSLLRRFYREVYVHWDMALVDEVVSPCFTSHDWPEGSTGPRAFRKYYAAIRSAVPDARYEVDDLIAEGDRVVVRWTMRGTHEGEFGDIAPTGRPIALHGIAIYRVDDGKLMERWVVSDLHGLLQNIGATSS
jgi:predicted ester cyclase